MRTRHPPTIVSSRPEPETPHDRFRRLANFRGKRLISNMQAMGRLGASSYEKTPDEVDRLISRLKTEFDYMAEQLRRGAGATDNSGDLI